MNGLYIYAEYSFVLGISINCDPTIMGDSVKI